MAEISVIAPVYGVEQYIYQFIQSVLNQTYTDFEFILVDDGSKDNCPQILDDYAKKDKRIKVIHQSNAGVAVARNTGIEAATGNYYYIVDSDDWLEPNALEVLIRDAKATGADIVMADCMLQKGTEKSRRTQFSKKFYTEDPQIIAGIQQYVLCQKFSPYYSVNSTNGYAAPWGKFIKAELIRNNNIRFEPYVKGIFDDGLFSLSLFEHCKSFYYGMECVYNYRLNDNSLTQKYKANEIEILRLGFEKIEEFITKYHREDRLTLPYYCHVVRMFIYRLEKHYFNVNNHEGYKKTKARILETLNSEPFKKSVSGIKMKYLLNKGQKYVLMCMRLHSVIGMKVYVDFRKYKKRINKMKIRTKKSNNVLDYGKRPQ